MPTYIIHMKWTDEGRKTVTDSLNRVGRAREIWDKVGAELKSFYYTLGRYDAVAVVEAPNDEAVAKGVLSAERWGAARFETSRAFSEAEAANIIKGL